MNVYRIYLLLISPLIDLFVYDKKGENIYFYFNPFVDDWQKGGEVFEKFLVYMHVFFTLFIKGEKDLCLCIYVLYCK